MDASVTTAHGNLRETRYQLARRVVLAVFLLASATEFTLRGPVRFLTQSADWNDFVPVYIPAQVWLHGGNPYEPDTYARVLTETFHRPWSAKAPRSHAVYPLSTFVWLSPIAALPWRAAQPTWTAVLLILIIGMLISMIKAEGLEGERAWIFVGLALILAPFHTGLATGNISMAAVALAGLFISALRAGNPVEGGIYLAAVLGLKPQIGLPLLLYYALRRHWLPCGIAIACVGSSFALGALRLSQSGIAWMHDFTRNVGVFVGSNTVDDFTSQNPIRFTLIDLQVPFYDLGQGRTAAAILALAVTLVLAAWWLILFWKARDQDDLLNVSTLAILSLLPVYHRFYDASLLVVPLCWTLCLNSLTHRWVRLLCWILFLPFLVPGTSLLQNASSAGRLPEALTGSWFWKLVVMPHETWALVGLVLTLLWAMRLRAREQSVRQG